MATFALDTNCLVAAVCTWHEHHDQARAEIERRLEAGEDMAVAAHALAEAYAVLTRLPAPHRLAPRDAWALLKANFVDGSAVAALDGPAYVALLETLAAEGTGGGRTYDRLIADCARLGGADALLTFNARHFDPASNGVRVVDLLRPR